MRFTPSDNWNLIASAAARKVVTTVDIKKTTNISQALSAGTWVPVSSYLEPGLSFNQKIEYEIGEFSSDSLTIVAGKGTIAGGVVQWFKDNIFNASESEYLEVRAMMQLEMGTLETSDTFYAFSGFVDKAEVVYNELQDSVTFTIFTADELGNRIAAESLVTQYVNNDVDGSGTPGTILPQIPGIYVVDADVASYQLKVGIHTIEYEYNGGNEQARLDNGDWLTLRTTDGIDTLISEDGLEKIDIYVDVSELYTSIESLIDYVVVKTAGDTLPYNPLYERDMKRYIKSIYAAVGITDVTVDTLTLNTADGDKKLSFYDLPPNDISITGKRYALVSDGTDMYMTVGNMLFKRTLSTGEYTLLATISGSSTSVVVKKIFYNSRNNDLYIVYTKSGVGDCCRRYDITGAVLSSEVVLDAVADSLNVYAMLLIDYNYTGSSYKYGLMYNDTATASVKFLDDSSLTVSTVITMAYPSASDASFVFEKSTGIWWVMIKSGVSTYNFNEITINSGGTWVDSSSSFVAMPKFMYGCYNAAEDVLYYFEAGSPYQVSSYALDGSATLTTIISNINFSVAPCIFCASNDKVYLTVSAVTGIYTKGTLYELSASAIDDSLSSVEPCAYSSMMYTDRLYGIQLYTGKLFQWHTVINMFINQVIPEGTVRSTLTRILRIFNLIGTISSHKKAIVLRRGDDAGTIQTSGNNMTLNITNVSDITQVQKAFQKIQWVQVSNGTVTFSYDGATFNAGVMSNARKLTISDSMIPDNIVKDLAKYLFTFYNADHDKYTFLVNAALLQYEVMDGASVTFSTTKISKTATGLITAQTINIDGSSQIEVLF